jgi:hypothetical protein
VQGLARLMRNMKLSLAPSTVTVRGAILVPMTYCLINEHGEVIDELFLLQGRWPHGTDHAQAVINELCVTRLRMRRK